MTRRADLSRQPVDDQVLVNREAFRAQAMDALGQFSSDDRELAASMDSKYTSTGTILDAWTEQIEPMYHDLEKKRSDARLKQSLVRHIGFHDNDASRMIDYMIKTRKQSLLDEVLDNLYHSDIEEPPRQREHALNFLSQTPTEIQDYRDRYFAFINAIETAERNNITLCDPNAPWLERQRTALAINKQRQHLAQNEDIRLEAIDDELRQLLADDTLLSHVVGKKLHLAQLLELATKYQRQVEDLSRDKQDGASMRLKLFERITSDFVEQEVERIATSHHAHTLKTLRVMQSEISTILLEIFDLTNTRRNQLLLDTQRYTRLIQERDLILLIQRNREHFFMETD